MEKTVVPWRTRVPGLALAIGLFALSGAAWLAGPPPHPSASPRLNDLVRWRDAQHDWLLVADRRAGELVVYDANDGRPLYRVGAEQGLSGVDTVIRQGRRLVVIDHGRRHVLTLPRLQPVRLADR